MKLSRLITLSVLAFAAFSCTKAELGSNESQQQEQIEQQDTTSTPVVPKYYHIPDEFKDCEFVAFVNSGNTCKSVIRASGWKAFSDSLTVAKGQTVALVAMGKGAEYSIEPQTPGQIAKSYSVIPVKKIGMPAIWSCQSTADSLNAATFQPVLRTFKMNLDVLYSSEEVDSVCFTIRQNDAVCPASPGIYSGTADVRYSIPVSDLGKTFDFMPMQTPTKEIFQEVSLYYKNKYRNCLIHFNKRASARYNLDVKFVMKEPTPLTLPTLRLTGSDADGQDVKKYTDLSFWDHSLTPVTGIKKNTSFKLNSGINMAFRYGSGVSWRNETANHDLCEPSIWKDNDMYIRKYVECGYDHFRIPIDEEALVYSDCSPRIAIMEDIKKMVDLSIKLGARVIIDLHWLKVSQKFPHPTSEAHFRECWKYLHECFKDYPTDMLAYEFLNEPNGNPEYWNFFIKNSIDMIRDFGGNELNRILVCSCIHGQDVSGTDEIELPSDTDPNLILSYHDYFPTEVTFYSPGNYPVAPVNYPGQVIRDEDWNSLSAEQFDHVQNPGAIYYKYHLENIIKHASVNGQRLKVPVWVGEFGCDQWTSIEVRRRWFQDKCDLFRQYNMSFASWFGLGVSYNDWYYVDQGILDATVVTK